ncbi:MAG TPA: phage tail tube protein [Phycisphaerae bacterium]|nr:phage tail tube protein [Phycisphaerae bacterium]
MSDTSRVQLAYIKESNFNTKKTGSNLQIIRKLSEDLALQAQTHVSGEMSADRQTSGIRRVQFSTAGPVNYELSYGTYDDWLASALQSTWQSPVTNGPKITIAAAATTNKYTDSGNGFNSFVVGQWVYVTGFANAANNGYAKIVSKAAGEIVVAKTLVTESVGPSVTVKQGGYVVNGTTLDTYNLERAYSDLVQELALFKGQAVNQWSFDLPTAGAITGAFNFIGASEEQLTASGGTGYTAASTTRPFGSLDLTNLIENNANMQIRSLSFTYDNQLHQRLVAGAAGVLSIGSGPIRIEGSLEAYYTDKTLYEKYVNETVSQLAVALRDPDGNGYVIEFPRVAFSSGNRGSSQSPDTLARMNFTAYKHPTEGVTARIARFPAA